MPTPIQLSLKDVAVRAPAGRLLELKRRFRRRHVVRLAEFLDRSVLAYLDRRLTRASFREHRTEGYEWRQVPVDRSLDAVFCLLLGDKRLFDFVSSMTGRPVKRVTGSLFRSLPGRHFLEWHRDFNSGEHVAALTVNLSPRPFQGGRLQIKRVGASRLHSQLAYRRRGEALLMATDRGLIHRSSPLRGRNPKLIFTCFFHRR